MKRKAASTTSGTTHAFLEPTLQSTLESNPSKEDIATALLALRTRLGITGDDLKKVKIGNPSPSAVWARVSDQCGLEKFRDIPEEPFKRLTLPPSVHENIMHTAAKWLSVYSEPYRQTKEAARVRNLDAWLVPLCALFHGRLINKPENRLPSTRFTGGHEVEVETFVMSGGRNEGLLLLVAEMKTSALNEDGVAQVLLELASAHHLNSKQTIHRTVFALLTDLRTYYFFSFNGTRFTKSAAGNIRVNRSRKEFFIDMAEVSERLFGVLFKGYLYFLRGFAMKAQGELDDLSTTSSTSQVQLPSQMGPSTAQKSLDLWLSAIQKAMRAEQLFRITPKTRDGAEQYGSEGLRLLQESVSYLPEPTFHFSADLGEGLKLEVDSALEEIFPSDSAAGEP